MAAPWTADPRAVALLASCAANPPRAKRRSAVYALTRDDWIVYVGRRAEQLDAIRSAYGAALLAEAQAADDYAAFEDWAFSATVEQALDAAVSAPALAVAA